MADFGSNFIDAFSAVYGAKLKSKQLAIEETRAANQEARAQKDFDYTQGERRKRAAIQGLMSAAGNVVNPGTNANEGMNAMTALQGEKTPNLAPATTADMQSIAARPTAALPAAPAQVPVQAPPTGLPAPAPAMTAPAPTATAPVAAAAIPTPAAPTAPVGIQAMPPAAVAPMPIGNPDENGNISTIAPNTPVISNADKAKLPNPDDYAETMLNGKHVWVPKDKVTKLSGGDLAMAQGQAVLESGLDPTLGMDMIKNAQLINKNNIEATVEKYSRAVLNAKASGDIVGAVEAYNTLAPSLTKAEVVPTKDGFTVKHYRANPDGSKMYVGEPETYTANKLHSAADQFFEHALSLSTPAAMQNHYTSQANDAVHLSTMAHQLHEERMSENRFAEEKRSNRVTEGQRAQTLTLEGRRVAAAERAENENWTVKTVMGADGTPTSVRTNKQGQVQYEDPTWQGAFVAPQFRNNAKLAQTMAATATAKGLSVGIDNGMPVYVDAKGRSSSNAEELVPAAPSKPTPAKPATKPAAAMPTSSAPKRYESGLQTISRNVQQGKLNNAGNLSGLQVVRRALSPQ